MQKFRFLRYHMDQIWARKKAKAIANHNLSTMFMLWQYVGISFEANLSTYGRQMLADLENIISMLQLFRKWIDHALSPWPPVEPLAARLVPLRL